MAERKSGGDERTVGDESLTRVFRAPRSLVFEVWTKAEHFARWFGPHGTEVLACEMDARPGGVIRFAHRFVDGPTFYFAGTFTEVVRNERIVFALGSVDENGRAIPHPMLPDWPLDASIVMSVTLEDAGEGTRVTVAHHVTPADANAHPAVKRWSEMAREGSKQVLDRLGEHLVGEPGAKAS